MKFILIVMLCVLLMKGTICHSSMENGLDERNEAPFKNIPSAAMDSEVAHLNSAHLNVQNCDEQQVISVLSVPGKDVILRMAPVEGVGVIYTRWGKTTCPEGATAIYDGYVAGGWYNQTGNGANALCMPKDPEYMSDVTPYWLFYLYGAEYQSFNKIFNGVTHDYNIPCTVCIVPRSTKLMVPAKTSCPPSFTREYYGYLMTEHYSHPRNSVYECIDAVPDVIPGSEANTDGALFYFVQAQCYHGLPCGPYITNRAVTCAVCTK